MNSTYFGGNLAFWQGAEIGLMDQRPWFSLAILPQAFPLPYEVGERWFAQQTGEGDA
jgi:hypothetical protein